MPLAVDTNVLARALVDDGSEQAAESRRCMIANEIYVPDSVLLETEWVLRSRLKLSREEINALFAGLLSVPSTTFENKRRMADVVVAHKEGLDFADALHLHSAKGCDAMLTYDEEFIRRSRKIAGATPVRKP
ncbi:hypothetical protein MesoLjLc_39160 [Mesorhizobium sp. L-8-10]|uniref:type II toxin-antitoxin system VapC family toxin n=1 Tax=Mesorhizobium sp. L-8-10 TaxID=2744523 RepID=UPI00192687C3|nr:type II toxin-antitoxin system VapC family toxin [Mesorhizobium sp. L-8-10]BCH31986.1 hypothetical protein MesoLjLc_39160 [Mesorhizobium sp. L-8-10]